MKIIENYLQKWTCKVNSKIANVKFDVEPDCQYKKKNNAVIDLSMFVIF